MNVKRVSVAPSSTKQLPIADQSKAVADDILLEKMAFQYGQVYDSYLACETGRERFWASDRSGVISYVKVAGHLKVGGGLLAATQDKPRLLQEFLDFVSKNHKSAAFFNITDEDLPLFKRHGIQVTKWGEDARIDLDGWDCKGKAFEWLRRQRNYCTRQKIRCAEWNPSQCSVDEFNSTHDELLAVANECLKSKPQTGEMRFFQGILDFENLGRKRIFLARADDGKGRIEAIVVANPYLSGNSWSFEIYRHRQDSVRGALPHLKLAVIDILKAEGVQEVSLCMIPGLNCHSIRPGDSGLVRRSLSWSARHLNALYDCAGLYHYKSRFRPRLESHYVCTYPRVSAMTFITTVHLTGLLRVSPIKVVKLAWRHLVSRGRASLPKFSKVGTK